MAERRARPTAAASALGIRGQIVELRDPARDGERELRSGAEPRVPGNRATNHDAHALAHSLRREVPPRKFRRALRLRALGLDDVGALELDARSDRIEHSGANAAESAAERAAKIEHAEVQSRGRLDATTHAIVPSATGPCVMRLRRACSQCGP